jgi:hypothetical protein
MLHATSISRLFSKYYQGSALGNAKSTERYARWTKCVPYVK